MYCLLSLQAAEAIGGFTVTTRGRLVGQTVKTVSRRRNGLERPVRYRQVDYDFISYSSKFVLIYLRFVETLCLMLYFSESYKAISKHGVVTCSHALNRVYSQIQRLNCYLFVHILYPCLIKNMLPFKIKMIDKICVYSSVQGQLRFLVFISWKSYTQSFFKKFGITCVFQLSVSTVNTPRPFLAKDQKSKYNFTLR